MVDEERRDFKGRDSCDAGDGGYTIFLEEEAIQSFMDSDDYSSSRELHNFGEISARISKRIGDDRGYSLMALSVNGKRISRDFSVLQIAHQLARLGKNVLIVDIDFIHPGLGGIVENLEEHGYLDLLLYGSSLKSVMKPTGIDGVSYMGAGSFPVSRTVPFAQKEFGKIKDFLGSNSDVIIYCSTLYTDDGAINPLAGFVDGVFLCCRIEEMKEGQLQQSLGDLGPLVSHLDLVCFCARKEGAEPPVVAGISPEDKTAGSTVPPPPAEGIEEGQPEPAVIEKTEEIEMIETGGGSKINLPRIVVISVAVVIAVFVSWWIIMNRGIRQRESSQQMSELVNKQRDVRDAMDRTPSGTGAADTIAGETAPITGKAEPPPGEEPGTVQPEPAVEGAAPSGGLYAVHVASFRDLERAGRETEYLEEKGYEVRVVEVDVRGEVWFRVYVGELGTREEAAQLRLGLLSLKRIGYAKVVNLER